MIPDPDQSTEAERVQKLRELNILDSPPEERFDRLTRLAKRLFGVRVALVSLIDEERRWMRTRMGGDRYEMPNEWSLCTQALGETEPLVVPDTRADPRFEENPLVRGERGIRFYAGQSIAAPNGEPVGTLCLLDEEPRELTEDELQILKDLAKLVERELATLQLATTDPLTSLSNRRGFKLLAEQSLALARRSGMPAALLLFDLDDFKEINDTLGHTQGDAALASFAADLLASYRESDVVARLGGDEFCVLLSGAHAKDIPTTLEKLTRRVTERNVGRDPRARIRYSVGTAIFDPDVHSDTAQLIGSADADMYANKRKKKPVTESRSA